MVKRILIILTHFDKKSLCTSLANSYMKGAQNSGKEVKLINLYDLKFDPILRTKDKKQCLESDLVKAQKDISWANHLVFVYPTWWAAIPALLKGFFDRTFTTGFAFRYKKDSPWWDKLLAGKTAHLIVTMDAPPLIYRFMFRQPGHMMMKKGILGFCGIKVKKITSIGQARFLTKEKVVRWLNKIEKYGAKGL